MNIKKTMKNALLSVGIFFVAIVLSILFQKLKVEEHITTVIVFAVFLISLLTDGCIYGIVSAVGGMLAVNYAFTYPYFALNFNVPVNLISAIIMTAISVLTGTLTTKIKDYEAEKAESERERMRAGLLRAVSHDLRTPLATIYSASSTLRNKKQMLTCISNVGPAFEAVGPYSSFAGYHAFSKIVLTFTMMLGRLEILLVLILFNKKTWKKF